ncbi:aldo/keto reductase [Streptomyces sp. NPDC007162]|uniref:aldo/keto reductase n=1 Tax=Streptomyces sp. NPDC007162 TaxID=3156917 RepID=UPI0033EBCBD5
MVPALLNFRKLRRGVVVCLTAVALAFAGLIAFSSASQAAAQGPCDIYAAGGTPCVAAHSTTRALFASYNGPLYQVQRSSDSTLRDIGPLSAGGVADAAAQDSFCAGTTCTITRLYDQTGGGNTLVYQGPGGTGGADTAATANTEALSVGGHKAYALYINPGNSYFAYNSAGGVPTGSSPEGEYMITSGTHVNNKCCFDYGNTEIDHHADGNGAMDAINFGTECWFGGCSGTGPWVQADIENGLFSGGSKTWNPSQAAQTSRFVTAMLKNNGYDETLHGFDKSAAKLGVDRIDLLILHQALPSEFDRTLDAYRALEKLLADGKVRAIGVSNFMVDHLTRLLDATDVVPAVNQLEIHPYFQQRSVLDFDTARGILSQAWSPIGGITFYPGYGEDRRSVLQDPAVTAIAERHGKSAAQVMLRWGLQQGRSVIPKSAKRHRIAENIDVFDFELTADELTALDALETGRRGGPEPENVTLAAYGRAIPEA